MDAQNQSTNPAQNVSRCPHCGYCPSCGRANAPEYHWPYYTTPYIPYTVQPIWTVSPNLTSGDLTLTGGLSS